MRPQPFLMWVGGKRDMVARLTVTFPRDVGRYWEPFIGGGSVFFHHAPVRATIGDANHWLVDTYEAVREDWAAVADVLAGYPTGREDYYRLRAQDPAALDVVERAALFIYLNRAGFRGLFRVNRAGRFNVPYGNPRRVLYDPQNLAACARALADVDLHRGGYEALLARAAPGDFVYLDPPYDGDDGDFTAYTAGGFGPADQEALAAACRDLDARGVRWCLSNRATPRVLALYRGFHLDAVDTTWRIASATGGRGVTEVVVRNYDPGELRATG